MAAADPLREAEAEQQRAQVARAREMEQARIPATVGYADIHGMRTEARLRLEKFRPATVGQAARIEGVTPADIAVLLVHLKRRAGAVESGANENSGMARPEAEPAASPGIGKAWRTPVEVAT